MQVINLINQKRFCKDADGGNIMIFLEERINRITEELQELIYPKIKLIESYKVLKSKEHFKEVGKLITSDWEICKSTELWGGDNEYFWFELEAIIPEEFEGECVAFDLCTGREGEWDAINPQFSVYVNGELRQGMDVNHRELILCDSAIGGELYRIILSAFTGDNNLSLKLEAKLKVLDRKVQRYYYDIIVPLQVAKLLDHDHEYISIIETLNESINLLDLRVPGSKLFYDSLEMAQEYVTTHLYDKYNTTLPVKVYSVGHTHIDVAWQWTLAVTKDKAVRSFSTVLELMRQYPEYIFMSSQPQLYQYVKERAPRIYEQIKQRVDEGRWEVEGGMFVEADCNLTSGESLVRQFLYGKRFFKKEFGKDNEILWLPDVFGYSAALPQIMKKSGIRYFMTTKISWNEFNKLPYDTFNWEGIDGSKVLTHFITARNYKKKVEEPGDHDFGTTYNGDLAPSQVMGGWQRYTGKHLNQETLLAYGFGDGGGGPTFQMLENQRRMNKGIPGCPKTVPQTAKAFFHRLEEQVRGNKYLPKWVGELYFEYHRGTYTSMARNKRYNRKAEFAYQNLELFSCMNKLFNQVEYPKADIAKGWEIILRNQFHDILPGSSIKEVYEDSQKEYEECFALNEDMMQKTLFGIAKAAAGVTSSLVVFNPNSFIAEEVITFSGPNNGLYPVVSYNGEELLLQKLPDNNYLLHTKKVPAKGYQTYEITYQDTNQPTQILKGSVLEVTTNYLENDYYRIELNGFGQFISIFDKINHREVLKEGHCGNVIMTYEDKPINYDAWDINHFYREKSWEVKDVDLIEVIEEGPIRAGIKISRTYLSSRIEQFIYIYRDIPRIDIRHEIDWQEKQIFVKEYYPVDIHANEASYDIQFGNVTRPTHSNTSWDFAKFEVCAHKWIDLSEDDYGLSVLNDCKYGFDIHDSVIGVSLIKSAISPNPDADKEHHSFLISLYPHKGGYKQSQTVQQAYLINNPLKGVYVEEGSGVLKREYSFVTCNVDNVIVETIKQAEDSNDIIIRVFETYNRRTRAELIFDLPISRVWECNLMEEAEMEIEVETNHLSFTIQPYEIRTFKIKR